MLEYVPFLNESITYWKLFELLSIFWDNLFPCYWILPVTSWECVSPIRKWFDVRVSKSFISTLIEANGRWLIMHSVTQRKIYRASLVNNLSRLMAFNPCFTDFIRDFQAATIHGLKGELNIHWKSISCSE